MFLRFFSVCAEEGGWEEMIDDLNVTKGVAAYRLKKYGLRIKRRRRRRKWKLN